MGAFIAVSLYAQNVAGIAELLVYPIRSKSKGMTVILVKAWKVFHAGHINVRCQQLLPLKDTMTLTAFGALHFPSSSVVTT